jgi:hypothetical protein
MKHRDCFDTVRFKFQLFQFKITRLLTSFQLQQDYSQDMIWICNVGKSERAQHEWWAGCLCVFIVAHKIEISAVPPTITSSNTKHVASLRRQTPLWDENSRRKSSSPSLHSLQRPTPRRFMRIHNLRDPVSSHHAWTCVTYTSWVRSSRLHSLPGFLETPSTKHFTTNVSPRTEQSTMLFCLDVIINGEFIIWVLCICLLTDHSSQCCWC